MTLKSQVQKVTSFEERLKLLHNAHQGEDCYILTCGPSLKEYSKEFLDEYFKDKVVIAVKQAYDRHPTVSNFHLFNCCNLPVKDHKFVHYDYAGTDTISLVSSNYPAGMRWSPFQEYDIFFKVPIRTEKGNEFICRTKKFDQFLMENTYTRPSGPGIMLETVIFTAVHLGVKNIFALGWDLSPNNIKSVEKYDHFFGSTQKLLNRGDMLDWEIQETREVTKDIFYWLKERGINLHLISNQSSLYENIPRLRIEDIPNASEG